MFNNVKIKHAQIILFYKFFVATIFVKFALKKYHLNKMDKKDGFYMIITWIMTSNLIKMTLLMNQSAIRLNKRKILNLKMINSHIMRTAKLISSKI